jgi:phage tail tape-measure protein
MKRAIKTGQLQQSTRELAELKAISAKLDRIEDSLDSTHKRTVKHGAIAGALAGSLSGGIVAAGIEFIRFKLGF